MNNDKKLEEAVIFLKKVAKEYKTYGDLDNPEFEDTKKIAESIEEVLQALKNSILKKKIKEIIENESINISGFECIAVENIQDLLEDK